MRKLNDFGKAIIIMVLYFLSHVGDGLVESKKASDVAQRQAKALAEHGQKLTEMPMLKTGPGGYLIIPGCSYGGDICMDGDDSINLEITSQHLDHDKLFDRKWHTGDIIMWEFSPQPWWTIDSTNPASHLRFKGTRSTITTVNGVPPGSNTFKIISHRHRKRVPSQRPRFLHKALLFPNKFAIIGKLILLINHFY